MFIQLRRAVRDRTVGAEAQWMQSRDSSLVRTSRFIRPKKNARSELMYESGTVSRHFRWHGMIPSLQSE